MFDGAEILVRLDDAFRQQESRRELAIGAWGTHDDGKRLPMQPHLERLLSGGKVLSMTVACPADSRHADAAKWSARIRHGFEGSRSRSSLHRRQHDFHETVWGHQA